MKQLGLIGYPLSHSFSKRYFTTKFQEEQRSDYEYELFPLPDIADLPELLKRYPDLTGLNVTIPHKQSVIPFLDKLDPVAERIGAVNTIAIAGDGTKTGYNTDYIGFREALSRFLGTPPPDLQALILGTGGAAQAVRVALEDLHIPYRFVSRNGGRTLHEIPVLSYDELDVTSYRLLINTTPLGMSPDTESRPPLPYNEVGTAHLLFDLVYNPPETAFLKAGKTQGAALENGLQMLHGQAEAAWKIWQEAD